MGYEVLPSRVEAVEEGEGREFGFLGQHFLDDLELPLELGSPADEVEEFFPGVVGGGGVLGGFSAGLLLGGGGWVMEGVLCGLGMGSNN